MGCSKAGCSAICSPGRQVSAMLQNVPTKWIRTASDREAVKLGYKWNQGAVDHVLKFSGTLRDPMDPARTYELLAWQFDATCRLFGWRRPDGRRRFNLLDLWIPKKNGKSSFLAFLGLVFLLIDGELRPGCYITSATGKLAGELFDEAKLLTIGTPWRKLLEIKSFQHVFETPFNAGRFACLPANAEGAEGLKGSFICWDEIHATLAKNPKLYGSMRYAGSGRLNPLAASISTAGDDRQKLPFKIYSHSKRVIAGQVIDLHILSIIYEVEDKAEFTDDDFRQANPAIGEILTLEQIRDDYERAKISVYELETFKRYRLNIWTKRSTAWLNASDWDAQGQGGDEPDLSGCECYVGLDYSGRLDLTAAVAVFPLGDDRFYVKPMFWLPRAEIDDRSIREMDYRGAAAADFIQLIDGPLIKYAPVLAWILELAKQYGIRQIGFDPNRAAELAGAVEAEGFECFQLKQGWGLSEACTKLESLIVAGQVEHDGNPILSWCIGNTEIRTDNNGKIRLVKPVEKHLRIDGAVALVMGLNLAMFAEPADTFVCG